MENSNTYIDILIDSLKKKSAVLDEIIDLNTRQTEIFSRDTFDEEVFKQTADEKGDLAKKLNDLDDGFEEVFKRVKDELTDNKEAHKDQIRELKILIKTITDKSVTVNAEEERINNLVKAMFARERRNIKSRKDSNSIARAYHKEMSRIDTITPQFMDKRK